MASFSATDVAFSGFRFVREHPRTIALWAAIQLVISVLAGVLTVEMAGPALTRLMALKAEPSRNPAEVLEAARTLGPLYLLIIPCALIFYAVIYAAVSRAVLEPDDDRVGYLRLGMDELRQALLFLLCIVVGLAAYVAAIVTVIVVGVGLALLARASSSSGAGMLAGIAAALGVLALFCGAIFVWVRLSLASPLTFDRRRVSLFRSWGLTRGRFWKLFGCYLLAALLVMVVMVLILIVSVAVGGVLGGLAGMGMMFRPDMSSLGAYFSPARLALLVIWAISAGLLWPVMLMPRVEIYKRLRAETSAVS